MTEDVEQWIVRMEARLDEARVAGNTALFEEVLGDDFRTTSPAGAVTGKPQMLADVRSGALRVAASTSRNISVRVYGETAVVTGEAVLRATYRGHDISGTYAYTHVYARQGGRWQVVAAHSSRCVPAAYFLVTSRLARLLRLSPG
jgi:hypothetical protein